MDTRTCIFCEDPFVGGRSDRRYCTTSCIKRCSEERIRRRKPAVSRVYFIECVECGELFTSRSGNKRTCGPECRRKRANRASCRSVKRRIVRDPAFREAVTAKSHQRRAHKLGLGSETVLLSYLIERDHGRCQLPRCLFRTRTVNPLGSRGFRHPRQPSIDHIIPISLGGEHSLANVQLAHYRCNLSKNNRAVGDQLALIG